MDNLDVLKLKVDLVKWATQQQAKAKARELGSPFDWMTQGTGYTAEAAELMASSVVDDILKANGDETEIADLVMFAFAIGSFLGASRSALPLT